MWIRARRGSPRNPSTQSSPQEDLWTKPRKGSLPHAQAQRKHQASNMLHQSEQPTQNKLKTGSALQYVQAQLVYLHEAARERDEWEKPSENMKLDARPPDAAPSFRKARVRGAAGNASAPDTGPPEGHARSPDDGGVMEAMLALGTVLRAVQSVLEGRVDEGLKAIHRDVEGSDRRLRRMEAQLDELSKSVVGLGPQVVEIAQAVGIDKHDKEVGAGDDEEDRKRIKEKLREALETTFERVKRNSARMSFAEYFFGICKTNGREGKIGSRLIHPQSLFMQGMLVASAIFLFYTALIVPVQICMWSSDDPCTMFPTLFLDAFVDVFFMFEALIQFFIGTFDMDMNYVDDITWIFKKNLSSLTGFWFDCFTSIPWSCLDLVQYLKCTDESSNVGTSAANDNARAVRVIKIFRILRVIRVLKLIKFVTLFSDYVVLHFGSSVYKIARLLVIALLSVHFFACAFFRVKKDTAPSPEDVDLFYESRNVKSTESFVSSIFIRSKTDDILNCTWLIGDISASSDGERVYCIFLFFYAASLFGTLISQVNEIVASHAEASKELDSVLESYLYLEPRPHTDTMLKIWDWERFQFSLEYEHNQHKALLERKLPDALKLALAKQIENNLFSKVLFLSGMNDMGEIRIMFSAEGSIVADSQELSNGLMVITSGKVGIELPMDSAEADEENTKEGGKTLLYVLERGDCIGDGSVVGDTRWAGAFGVQADFIARTHCSIGIIKLEDIQAVLEKFEFFPIKCKIQRAANIYRQSKETLEALQLIEGNTINTMKSKAIFFWTLLVREITRFYHANPALRLQQLPVALALHDSLEKTNDTLEFDLSPQETQQIKDIFDLFDTDGGGSIDSQELDAALFALGFHGSIERRGKAKAEKSGTAVTLEDFISILKGEKSSSCQKEDVWLSFSVLSRSTRPGKRGGSASPSSKIVVDHQEAPNIKLDALKTACQEFEVRLTEDELAYMMDQADYDKRGSVDIHKFMHIMQRTPWF